MNLSIPSPGPARASRLRLIALIIALTFGLTAAAQAGERNPRWAAPVDLPGAENFYRISPGLYRSAQPSAEAFSSCEKLGIKTVIDLRTSQIDRRYIRGGSGLKLIGVPMKAGKIGDDEVITVMRLIKNEPGPILIHCLHGADRTGMMSAMYRLVFENWTKEEALDELVNGGYGFHSMWKNIPKYIREVDVNRIRQAVDSAAEDQVGPKP